MRPMIFLIAIFSLTGCEYVRVDDILLMDDPHSECRDKHYLDPYTKVEYCLPTEFSNMSMIHLYRVEK